MKTAFGLFYVAFSLFLGLPQTHASPLPLCASVTGNLVSNCGFQSGDFMGWTLTGNDVPLQLNDQYGVEGTDPLDGIAPHSGSDQAFFADLDANATTLSQTLSTVAGKTYVLSFYLAQDTATVPPYSNLFSASFAGVSLESLTAVGVEGYTKYSYAGVASTSSSVLSLTLGNDLGEFLLDDVSVTLAPEPSTWMMAFGGSLLALIFRRKG
jgi:hypothetical protein